MRTLSGWRGIGGEGAWGKEEKAGIKEGRLWVDGQQGPAGCLEFAQMIPRASCVLDL